MVAFFKGLATKWKVVAFVAIGLLVAIGVTCLIAGIKSGVEEIGFFDALGQLFGASGEVIEDVVTDPEAGEAIEGGVEACINLLK